MCFWITWVAMHSPCGQDGAVMVSPWFPIAAGNATIDVIAREKELARCCRRAAMRRARTDWVSGDKPHTRNPPLDQRPKRRRARAARDEDPRSVEIPDRPASATNSESHASSVRMSLDNTHSVRPRDGSARGHAPRPVRALHAASPEMQQRFVVAEAASQYQ